ncbi:5-oxoprolinase subunit PxpB [Pseudomonas oryzihabitans]|uniref:5-oxoprolinase subunit PxpB n=1 Tax=Pseudomonas oryzihabitans TaxID=47885 RepID=UPI001123DC51|nr:5-oxoprolinase subunit PxpB [Pseudomonas psychrotolerans]QDD91290.1 hypothetical protein CCZ28_20650 [Pseudomonas psychrotolerans]
MNTPQFHRMGTRAILVESQQPQADVRTQQVYWAFDQLAAGLFGLVESVPGMNNLLLIFEAMEYRENALADLHHYWGLSIEQSSARDARQVTVGVLYGGAHGKDLPTLAERAQLSVDEFVMRHAAAEYTVFCLGAHPGFAYLGGLHESLYAPRQSAPRPQVSAGSVAIGGSQTGVIAANMPSGWNLIGATDTVFFDHRNEPPALLAPGDRVCFEVRGIEA